MVSTIRAFMHNMIDYAGTFPPARLPLKQAVDKYLEYSYSDHSWMLGPFVIPASFLGQVHDLLSDNQKAIELEDLRFAFLLSSNLVSPDWNHDFLEDLSIISDFISRGSNYQTTQIELKVPLESFFDETGLERIREMLYTIEVSELKPEIIYIEGLVSEPWDRKISKMIDEIGNLAKDNVTDSVLGIKVRTGGISAELIPPSDFLAFVLNSVVSHRICFKATAGLHHPFRHYNASLNTMEHGFINVFGALFLAMQHDLSEETVRRILEDQNPHNFSFDGHFCWKEYCVEIENIKSLRRFVRSFGSCSFEEPLFYLSKMALLTLQTR